MSAAGALGSDAATEAGQPLAEPQQTGPASGGVRSAHAVVVHSQRHRAGRARCVPDVELDGADGGVAVADDVGGALAHYPAQGCLHVMGKGRRVADDAAARPG